MTAAAESELQALKDRVEALEQRLARLGTADDDTYEYLCARQFQLQDDGPDGQPRCRGLLRAYTYPETGESFAELALYDAQGRPRIGVTVGESPGIVFLNEELQEEISLVGGYPDADLSPGIGVCGPTGKDRVELTRMEEAAGVLLKDSQGRLRGMFAVGGDLEDRAILRLEDADGNPGVMFSTGSMNGSTSLDGWPAWADESLTRLSTAIEEGGDEQGS